MTEYESLVMQSRDGHGDNVDDAMLLELLAKEHEWSQEGAEALLSLARNYGAFMLRNALALAVALDIEDGTLGF